MLLGRCLEVSGVFEPLFQVEDLIAKHSVVARRLSRGELEDLGLVLQRVVPVLPQGGRFLGVLCGDMVIEIDEKHLNSH